MAAKIDKEFLLKNRFWIGLGGFVLLWLIGVIIVLCSGDSTPRTTYQTAKDAIDKAAEKRSKTPAYLTPWNEHAEKFRKHKDVVWEAAWKQQQDMYRWPEGMRVVPLYPQDPFGQGEDDLNARSTFRTDLYPTQFTTLASEIAPVELAGATEKAPLGSIVPLVSWDPNRAPTREEIWLAQEDFWVRKELLNVVSAALGAVAWFRELPSGTVKKLALARNHLTLTLAGKDRDLAIDADLAKKLEALKDLKEGAEVYCDFDMRNGQERLVAVWEKKPAGFEGRRLFRNPNWELDLLLVKEKDGKNLRISEKSTIKNVNRLERTLALANPSTRGPMMLRLWTARGGRYNLEISGEPLAPGQSAPLKKEHDTSPVNLAEPFYVEQVLVWELSPVRRINALKLAHNSHRMASAKLQIREDLKKLDPDTTETDAKSGTPTTPGGPGGGMAGGPTGGPGGGMMGGPTGMQGGPTGVGSMPQGGAQVGQPGVPGVATAGETTKINKIPRARYLHVKEQARHLPFAMQLIVDQAHVHDVLAAFANSKLRIQVTQVNMHQAANVARSTGPKGDMVGTPGGSGPGGLSPAMMPRLPPGGGPAGFTPQGPPAGVGSRPPGTPGTPAGVGSRPPDMSPSRPPTTPVSPPPDMGKDKQPAAQAQDTARLVEMTVFGIATLYERFPPRPKTTPAPPVPGQPTP